MNIELKIDKAFKTLIRPLRKQEYLQLETNILNDGCRDPIITWKGVIIDGHNRYEICTRHNIPFETKEMSFENRAAAVAWICANQLGRRNITEETRKYLIGMQYEAEKYVNGQKRKEYLGQSPATNGEPTQFIIGKDELPPSRHLTALKIANDNHVSTASVQKYAQFTRAIDIIGKAEPKLKAKILTGRYKISHNNLLELSQLSEEEIKRINRHVDNKLPYIKYSNSRETIQNSSAFQGKKPDTSQPSIKDMPTYDPDAPITELSLTIPSWIGSMQRAKARIDKEAISENAKAKLHTVLNELITNINEFLSTIKED